MTDSQTVLEAWRSNGSPGPRHCTHPCGLLLPCGLGQEGSWCLWPLMHFSPAAFAAINLSHEPNPLLVLGVFLANHQTKRVPII